MRVLVTGANGLLGGYLCDRLGQTGREVTATGRGARQVDSPVEYTACALDDATAVDAMIDDTECGIVVHCAAQLTGNDEALFQRNNVEATLNLAQAAKRRGVGKFLFCSTVSVYAGDGPFHEQSPACAADHYATSKIAAENALAALADREFQVMTLRLAGLHGAPRASGVVHAMLGAARAGRPIRIEQPGTRLSIAFLDDVVELLPALWQLSWPRPRAMYNLASPDAPTLLELAQMIVSKSGSDSELQCGDGAARNRVLDVSRLSREMGLTTHTIPDRIDRALSKWPDVNNAAE
jgi:nucleoside-diphosphate-sugar epimerase